jgi:ATP/maltotriose-dependent transcriptional regulator MalT
LFVVGEGGLGKTSVLEAARHEALAAGMGVGFARCEQLESSLAFGVAREALGELAEFDHEPVAESSAPYYRALQGLQQREGGPLLVAVDDLHWADLDSLRLLAFLVRRLEGLPVAVLGTFRPWPREAADVFGELAAAGECRVERLAALSRASAAALLFDRAGGPVSENAERGAWRMCAGNPLLIGELARAVARGEHVPESAGEREASAVVASGLLLSRFAGVDRAALECARAGSVLGTTFRPELAAVIAGLPEGEIDGVLESLSRSGLVVEDVGGTRFAHPLFAEALYDDLPVPVRRRLHERAFGLFADRGLEPAAAAHAIRAGLVGDARASEVLERVGRAALAAGAIASAVQTLKAAVAAGGKRSSVGVSLALAEAQVSYGAAGDALGLLENLLAEPVLPWRERQALLRMYGRAQLLTTQIAGAEVTLEQAIVLAIENDQPELAVQALLDACLAHYVAEGPARAEGYARRALDLADHAPSDVRERALATWGRLALEAGNQEGLGATEFVAERVNARAGRSAAGLEECAYVWGPIEQFAWTSVLAERYELAEAAYAVVQARADHAGAVSALHTSLCMAAWFRIRRGRLEQALADVERCVQLTALFPAGRYDPELLGRAEALLWLGKLDESEASLLRGKETAPDTWWTRFHLARVRGQRLLWQGDPAAAERFAEVEELTGNAGYIVPPLMTWAGHAVAAYLAVDRVKDAVRVTELLEERIAAVPRLPCRGPKIQAHTARAALAARTGDDAGAERHYLSALALHAEIDLPLLRVETLLAYGAFLRRHGRPRDARAPLGEARQLAETLEAGWFADTARRELQLAGGRRRRRTEDRDQLTDAEQHVAKLAAAWLTNAEIARRLYLSPSTIETHLRHIYGKLEISSRRELQALAPGFLPPQPGEQPQPRSASQR